MPVPDPKLTKVETKALIDLVSPELFRLTQLGEFQRANGPAVESALKKLSRALEPLKTKERVIQHVNGALVPGGPTGRLPKDWKWIGSPGLLDHYRRELGAGMALVVEPDESEERWEWKLVLGQKTTKSGRETYATVREAIYAANQAMKDGIFFSH